GTQPWSSGRVGLLGISYYAAGQWFVAAMRPPHLAAILPWQGTYDFYRDRTRHNGDLREQCARGLPAFGASTNVIIGALGRNAHLDGIARAFARECPSREVRRAGPHTVVHCRMN